MMGSAALTVATLMVGPQAMASSLVVIVLGMLVTLRVLQGHRSPRVFAALLCFTSRASLGACPTMAAGAWALMALMAPVATASVSGAITVMLAFIVAGSGSVAAHQKSASTAGACTSSWLDRLQAVVKQFDTHHVAASYAMFFCSIAALACIWLRIFRNVGRRVSISGDKENCTTTVVPLGARGERVTIRLAVAPPPLHETLMPQQVGKNFLPNTTAEVVIDCCHCESEAHINIVEIRGEAEDIKSEADAACALSWAVVLRTKVEFAVAHGPSIDASRPAKIMVRAALPRNLDMGEVQQQHCAPQRPWSYKVPDRLTGCAGCTSFAGTQKVPKVLLLWVDNSAVVGGASLKRILELQRNLLHTIVTQDHDGPGMQEAAVMRFNGDDHGELILEPQPSGAAMRTFLHVRLAVEVVTVKVDEAQSSNVGPVLTVSVFQRDVWPSAKVIIADWLPTSPAKTVKLNQSAIGHTARYQPGAKPAEGGHVADEVHIAAEALVNGEPAPSPGQTADPQPHALPGALLEQTTPSAAVPTAGPTKLSACWKYDVFISHAGEDKTFATFIFDDLQRLGLTPFLDQLSLLPGGNSVHSMNSSINNAPIGLAIVSRQYLRKKWPMRELRIIMDKKTLLPVLYGITHEEFERELLWRPWWQRMSSAVSEEQVAFSQAVREVTYLDFRHTKGYETYHLPVRQRLCLHALRKLAELAPQISHDWQGYEFLSKVQNAIQEVIDGKLKDLTQRDIDMAKDLLEGLKHNFNQGKQAGIA